MQVEGGGWLQKIILINIFCTQVMHYVFSCDIGSMADPVAIINTWYDWYVDIRTIHILRCTYHVHTQTSALLIK